MRDLEENENILVFIYGYMLCMCRRTWRFVALLLDTDIGEAVTPVTGRVQQRLFGSAAGVFQVLGAIHRGGCSGGGRG